MVRFAFAAMLVCCATLAVAQEDTSSLGHYDYPKLELGCAIFAPDPDDCRKMVRELEQIDLEIPWDIIRISVETPSVLTFLNHLREFTTKYHRVWQYRYEEAEAAES